MKVIDQILHLLAKEEELGQWMSMGMLNFNKKIKKLHFPISQRRLKMRVSAQIRTTYIDPIVSISPKSMSSDKP
jgi:hypothetical protein